MAGYFTALVSTVLEYNSHWKLIIHDGSWYCVIEQSKKIAEIP